MVTLLSRIQSLAYSLLMVLSFSLALLPLQGQVGQETMVEANREGSQLELVDATLWAALLVVGDKVEAGDQTLAQSSKIYQKLLPRLQKVYPNQNFRFLGEHEQDLFKQYEAWLVPSKEIFLKLDSRGPDPKKQGVRVHLQLWQQKKVLLKVNETLRPDRPLFLAGPKWRNGRLLVLVLLKE